MEAVTWTAVHAAEDALKKLQVAAVTQIASHRLDEAARFIAKSGSYDLNLNQFDRVIGDFQFRYSPKSDSVVISYNHDVLMQMSGQMIERFHDGPWVEAISAAHRQGFLESLKEQIESLSPLPTILPLPASATAASAPVGVAGK